MILQAFGDFVAFLARKLYRFDGEAMVVDFEDEQSIPEELRQKFYSDEHVVVVSSRSRFIWNRIAIWQSLGSILSKIRRWAKSQGYCEYYIWNDMEAHAIILRTMSQNQYQLRILMCEDRASWIKLCFADHPNMDYMLAYEKAKSCRPGLFVLAEKWSS